MQEGDRLDRGNSTAAALAAYLEAEKSAPPTAALLHRIAKQYGLSMNDAVTEEARKKAAETALGYAKRSVALDAKDPDAHIATAVCLGRILPWQDTRTRIASSRLIRTAAETALRLNPEHELSHYVLGAWHYEMSGLNSFERGLARLIYEAIPPASYAEAAAHFQRAHQQNPRRMATCIDLGRTYLKLRDPVAARRWLLQGLALPNRDRDDPAVRTRGAQALTGM